ncbi:MAG: hypothetical protein KIT84_01845 [Labilithrix sp.]|nr:hypothetical protein [Labilithrix sp.]MCW5809730.1 hypothetical protein [Labilithrix sp.]
MHRASFAATLLASLVVARVAAANCARPVGYEARVTDGGAVVVTPVNFDRRGCSPSEALLRQDVGSGEVVRIDTCAEAEAGADDDGRAYVDACVKPGTYRYGFERPYECVSSACSTSYFEEIKVTTAPGSPCVAPVRAKVASVPWGSSPTICSYTGGLAKLGAAALAVIVLFVAALVYGVRRLLKRKTR